MAAPALPPPYPSVVSLNMLGRLVCQGFSGNASRISLQWPRFAARAVPAAMFILNAATPSPSATRLRTAAPSPGHVPPAVHIAHASGGIDWSIVLPTWLGALATAGLLVGGYFTALYAKRAFGEQAKEVKLIQDQLAEERGFNRRQAAVLDLQARDLRESLEERKRESDLRHRYQAVRVFPHVEIMPGEPTRYFVIVKNASNLPVYNVFPAMHYRLSSSSRGSHNFPEHLKPALMPGDTLRLPAEGGFAWEVPSGSEEVWTQIWFRDAELVHWTVTSKGEIVEQNGSPLSLGSRGQRPADLEPGHRPRGRQMGAI